MSIISAWVFFFKMVFIQNGDFFEMDIFQFGYLFLNGDFSMNIFLIVFFSTEIFNGDFL